LHLPVGAQPPGAKLMVFPRSSPPEAIPHLAPQAGGLMVDGTPSGLLSLLVRGLGISKKVMTKFPLRFVFCKSVATRLCSCAAICFRLSLPSLTPSSSPQRGKKETRFPPAPLQEGLGAFARDLFSELDITSCTGLLSSFTRVIHPAFVLVHRRAQIQYRRTGRSAPSCPFISRKMAGSKDHAYLFAAS